MAYYGAEYPLNLKEDYITNRILIRKIFKYEVGNKLPSYPSNLDTPEEGDFSYGYQPLWLRLKEVSVFLGLKPIKMRQALRELGMVSDNEFQHLTDSPQELYYYESVITKTGFPTHGIRFNADKLEMIKRVAVEFPDLFPQLP